MPNQVTRRPQNWMDTLLNDDVFSRFTYGTDVDIYKEGSNFVVEADIPGFEKENINIEFKGDVLTISAEQNEETEDTTAKNYFYRSRSTRKFSRQIRFSDIDSSAINASYENGVLKVLLPIIHADRENSLKIDVK